MVGEGLELVRGLELVSRERKGLDLVRGRG